MSLSENKICMSCMDLGKNCGNPEHSYFVWYSDVVGVIKELEETMKECFVSPEYDYSLGNADIERFVKKFYELFGGEK